MVPVHPTACTPSHHCCSPDACPQGMEDLTAQLDSALLSGPPTSHARAADDDEEEIDLGDLGDIIPELSPKAAEMVATPSASSLPAMDGCTPDEDPLQRQQAQTTSGPPHFSGDGPLGRRGGGSGSSSSLRAMEDGDGGHHPFTYGQLMPPPAAPMPSAIPQQAYLPSAGGAAYPSASGRPGDDDPLSDPLSGDRGGPSGSGGGGSGDQAGPSRPPWHNGSASEINEISEDEPPLLSPGSRVRLQYTLPPGMQFEAAAAGPSSSSSTAAPSPLLHLPRMSQRDVPLVVTVTDPVKKEQPGIMFGIMGGYVAYLVTSKAPPPSPRRSLASQPPPPLLSKPVATVRRRFRDFVALSDVLKIRSASMLRMHASSVGRPCTC